MSRITSTMLLVIGFLKHIPPGYRKPQCNQYVLRYNQENKIHENSNEQASAIIQELQLSNCTPNTSLSTGRHL